MVSGVITSEDQKFNLGIKPDELKEVKSHIATIFNILFSMVAVYVAVYKVSQSMFNDLGLVRGKESGSIKCTWTHCMLMYIASVDRISWSVLYWYSRGDIVYKICLCSYI